MVHQPHCARPMVHPSFDRSSNHGCHHEGNVLPFPFLHRRPSATDILTSLSSNQITSKHSDATQQTTMKAISYVMIPLGFIVTSFMPAGLQWYFVTASVPSLVQTWLMVQPWFRRWIGMMPLPEPLASAPISSISTTGTSTQSPPGMIESMKKSLRDATEAATAKREGTKQRKSKETSEAEEAKLQAEYYESLRERMAELEKQMKRRP